MTVMSTTEPRRPELAPAADAGRGARAEMGWLEWSLVVAGLAMGVLVGQGSPIGILVRIGIVLATTALAVRSSLRTGPLGRGLVAVAAGTIAVVAGLGIGASFAIRAGLSARAVAGLVELAVGLLLVGVGTVVLVRRTHGWRRWTAIPIAFVVLQFVAVPLFGAVVITNVPPDTVEQTTPADHGLAYEDVSFVTSDGVTLSGWYVPSRNGAAVVVLAGSGSTRSGALEHGAVLARHGYGTLIVDNRGHGRSAGTAMDTGWFGSADIAGAMGFLEARADIDPARIGLVGLSMGGEEAIGAAGDDGRIRAVVAEGATGRSDADLVDVPAGITGGIERVTSWEQFRVADLLTDAARPAPLVEAAQSSRAPMLLIAGRGEGPANRRLRDAAPARIELWELPTTAHVGALAERRDEWEQRVTSFLDRTLAG
jgi:fermentation-respiration switch protein FrsA (DUF1100 family)